MSPFILSLGRPFIGSALRRLAELFQAGASEWYAERGIRAPLRTAGAILLLRVRGRVGVVEMATELRQSHPTIISWIKELEKLGLVDALPSDTDGRRTSISLTETGAEQAERVHGAQTVLADAYAALCEEADVDLFEGVLRMEDLCRRLSMADRLREAAERTGIETERPLSEAS